MKQLLDIPYTSPCNEAQMLDVYLPEADTFPVFVYFHGGGLENGNRKSEAHVAEYLCRQGIAFVSVEYRMYPTAHWPDFIEDGAAALAWVHKNIRSYGGTHIYAGGCSAGAYISMMLCFDARFLAACGLAPTDIAGYIHAAGQPTAHFNVLREKGIDPRRVIVDETAPLYHVGTAAAYAPMLILVSDNDMAGRLEQTELLVAALRHFGYDESKLCYRLMPGGHCAYIGQLAEDGASVLAHITADYIKSLEDQSQLYHNGGYHEHTSKENPAC